MPLRNLTWLTLASVISLVCYGEAQRNRYAGILSESIAKISAAYVEPVDPRALFEGGLRGMLFELDPHSGYISPDEYREFRVDIEQHFGGIGIEVGMQDGRLTILNPVPATPAYEAGLMAGDIIVSIDGQTMDGRSLGDAVKLMRGIVGTPVTVEVLRGDSEATTKYTMNRAEIRIESVRGDRRDRSGTWSFVLADHPRIGYIRVSTFGDRTAEDLQQALQTIAGRTDGLILDLRGNAGGLLTSAVEICDLFLPPGQVIVTTRGRDAQVAQEFKSERPALVDPKLPVVVLVDRFSASASEIVAACLQDHQRATIVGERTYGKGTVQNVFPIEGGRSAIRLTTQTYWRPSGENIHRNRGDQEDVAWGVRPAPEDLVEFSREEFQRVYEWRRQRDFAEPSEALGVDKAESESADKPTEESSAAPIVDRQLQRAIELLERLGPAPFSKPQV